jgi:hypothetical protein
MNQEKDNPGSYVVTPRALRQTQILCSEITARVLPAFALLLYRARAARIHQSLVSSVGQALVIQKLASRGMLQKMLYGLVDRVRSEVRAAPSIANLARCLLLLVALSNIAGYVSYVRTFL